MDRFGCSSDLTGGRFGALLVLHKAESGKVLSSSMWRCKCDCGKISEKRGSDLYSGNTKSCGCRCAIGPRKYSRNVRKDPEYTVWKGLRARVNGMNHISFKRYGGRGLIVDPIFDDYEVFLAEVGTRPTPKHWIERKDNSLGYVHGNLCWELPKKQARNTRRNKVLTFKGETRSLVEWCEVLNLPYSAIRNRLRVGWSDSDALTKPIRKGNYRRKEC